MALFDTNVRKGAFAIEIEGAEDVTRKLAQFEGKVGKRLFRKAARKAANIVLKDARARVPVDTGALKASLAVRALKRSRVRFGVAIGTRELTQKTAARLGVSRDKAFYGAAIELGTGDRYTKDGRYTGRITAQPFLRPALYDNEDIIRGVFIHEMRRLIREEEVKSTPF